MSFASVCRSRALALILPIPFLIQVAVGHAAAEQSSGTSRFDGPAELPRVQVRSALADTPAPGRTRLVKENENLQDALNDAKCGDTLKLQAGATFHGMFRFPQKPCDDSHWIIVRTSAPDDALPPEGTRITPCYGGVASLPGRPDFHCSSPHNVMAKIELDVRNDAGPIFFLDGANHYRLVGLEITRALPEMHLRNLIELKDITNGTANHLVFDRLWLHGLPQEETKSGILLNGITYAAIVDSYFNDFTCIAGKGTCTDAQAIGGGIGRSPGGPYKIENNFLEASGQSIMFGGGGGTITPTDIEIRHNHLFKPLIWMKENPGFVAAYTGSAFIVKNNFELKNAQRVLFEGNLLENSWGGFTQTGFSVLLTPANQRGHCPTCQVTDVTIRYCLIRNVGSGFQIATVDGKLKQFSQAGERYSIHDVVVDDIQGAAFKGFGILLEIVSQQPPVKDIRFDHLTGFPSRAVLWLINRGGEKLSGISLTNSIFDAGKQQIASAGGGKENCIQPNVREPSDILNVCFANAVVSHNLILHGSGNWPEHNIFVKDSDDAGLWKSQKAGATEYRICQRKGDNASCKKASPAVRAASDGRDIGADVEAIEKATAGVIEGKRP